MSQGLSGKLQHPRRSLGDRHRSQANKFVKLASSDAARAGDNYGWAEQNARQALLFDFTHPDNWRVLANIKVILNDEIGLRALLSDLFSVLGRDPDQGDHPDPHRHGHVHGADLEELTYRRSGDLERHEPVLAVEPDQQDPTHLGWLDF